MTKVKLYHLPTDRTILFYISRDITTKEELREILLEFNQNDKHWIVLDIKAVNKIVTNLIKAIVKSTTNIEDVICHCHKYLIV